MKQNKVDDFRLQIQGLSNKKYFNYGGQGPLPSASLDAIIESWKKIQDLGPFTTKGWVYVISEIEKTRSKLASICNVSSHRIALTENVTIGCILPLWGLPFSIGDRILISDSEHPGVVATCKELALRYKLKMDILNVKDLRDGLHAEANTQETLQRKLEKALHPKTKLVVLSHILWNTGQIIPIETVADMLNEHQNHPYLLVDAAQTFGQVPIKDVANKVDIYAFTGHKWAFGPEGLGGLVVSERILADARPTFIGWRGLKHEGSALFQEEVSPLEVDSRRFEIATSCTPLLAGLRCSLELLEGIGREEERLQRIRKLSHELWIKLRAIKGVETILEGPPPSGLVSFFLQKDNNPKDIVKVLGKKAIWIRDLEDPKCLRACLHITSTSEEIYALSKEIECLV